MICVWPFDTCTEPIRAVQRCARHYKRYAKHGNRDVPLRRLSSLNGEWGDWYVDTNSGYVRRARTVGGKHERQTQHRVVMEEILGRRLVHGENVHHINGVRTDNRAENLELWNTSQPSGQRAKDKLAWAKEIIDLYEGRV